MADLLLIDRGGRACRHIAGELLSLYSIFKQFAETDMKRGLICITVSEKKTMMCI